MISSFGSVSSSALRISAPVHQPFIATSTASSAATAQNVMIHSRQLAAHTATRSPAADAVVVAQRDRERRNLRHELVEREAEPVAEHVAVAVTEALGAERISRIECARLANTGSALAEHVLLDDLERHARRR